MCIGEVFEPVTPKDAEMLENPWHAEDRDQMWRPRVRASGRHLSVPVHDLGGMVSLKHRHAPLSLVFPRNTIADNVNDLVRGLPDDAVCCGLRTRDEHFHCYTQPPFHVFEVVGACSGRPFRMETSRPSTAKNQTMAATSDHN